MNSGARPAPYEPAEDSDPVDTPTGLPMVWAIALRWASLGSGTESRPLTRPAWRSVAPLARVSRPEESEVAPVASESPPDAARAAPLETWAEPPFRVSMPAASAGVAFARARAPLATSSAPFDRRVRSPEVDWIVASARPT